MNRISNAVLSFFELVEAEGREFRSQAERMMRRALFAFFGGMLLLASALAAGFAAYAFLSPLVGPAASALIVALVLGAGGIFLMRKGAAKAENNENGLSKGGGCDGL